MPSKTTNYQLNQWEGSDNFLRTDFNEDNARIDSALKGLADQMGTKASQGDLNNLAATVSGKAEQAAVHNLSSTVTSKADQTALNSLSATAFYLSSRHFYHCTSWAFRPLHPLLFYPSKYKKWAPLKRGAQHNILWPI